MRALRIASVTSASFAFLLVVWGGIVRLNNAGMTCPDWPRCRGAWIPALRDSVLYEWTHRLGAPLLALLIVAVLLAAWYARACSPRTLRVAWLSFAMLVAQVLIGALTIKEANSPPSVALHLTVGIATFASLVLVALSAYGIGPGIPNGKCSGGAWPRRSAWFRRLTIAAIVLALATVAAGGFMSAASAGGACPGLPLCNGFESGLTAAQHIHMIHRFAAYATLAVVVVIFALAARMRRSAPSVFAAVSLVAMLALLQAVLGVLTVVSRLEPALRVAHQANGALLVAALAALAYVSRYTVNVAGLAPAESVNVAAGLVPAESPRWLQRSLSILRDYIALTKPNVMSLLLFTTLAAMLIAARGFPAVSLMAWTLFGGALAAASAAALNMVVDRDLDAVMRRTSKRPIPGGRISSQRALTFGVALGLAAFLILGLAVNWLSAALALCGILYYVFVYTLWLKRSTPQNIVIGGAAGAMPPLVGWAAVTNHLGLTAFLLFLIIFVWTPPHFWALALLAKGEYAKAGVPMLPVVRGDAETKRQILLYSAVLAVVTLALVPLHVMGIVYLVCALVLDAFFLAFALGVVRLGTVGSERLLYRFSMLYLALLFTVMAVDRFGRGGG